MMIDPRVQLILLFSVVAIACKDILAHVVDMKKSEVVPVGNVIPQLRESADIILQEIFHKELRSGFVPVLAFQFDF